jgi:uncharacterized membrane protein
MKSQRKIPSPGRMPDPEAPPDSRSEETLVEMGRLNALSDGVIAIALTILVLEIRLPEVTQISDLGTRLVALSPRLLIYLISFIIIGGAWGSHQRMLSQIKRGDGPLVWFNLFSLLFITLLPAAAALLGSFPGAILAILVFSADVIMIQLAPLLLWRHASNSGLINPALDPRIVVGIGRRLTIIAIAFALTIPLALINAILVYALWVLLFIFIFTTDWLSWQQGLISTRERIPLGDARQAQVLLMQSGGRLIVAPGTTEGTLIEGTFGGGVTTETQMDGDVLKVSMVVLKKSGFMSYRYPWAWGPVNLLDWNLHLNSQIPLKLEIATYGGVVDLDFSGIQLTELLYSTSAASSTITLPAHTGHLGVKIQANNSSLVICIPPGVAAYIHSKNKYSSFELDTERFQMIKLYEEYKSSDYDTAENRVDLMFEVAATSIKFI